MFTALNMLLFISPQFIELTKSRCEITSYKSYDYVVKLLFQFLVGIKDFFLCPNIWLFAILLVLWLIILMFVKDNIKKIKFDIYSFSLLFAAFIFCFMMFFVNTFGEVFILSHWGLRFLFSSLLLSLIFSSVGFAIKYADSKNIINTIKIFMLLPLLLFFNKDNFIFNTEIDTTNYYRENAYILEKVYDMLYHKNI